MWYKLDTIVAWAKRRGFVYPGSAIYWGLANAWDLWPYGVELRRNIIDIWWQSFVQQRSDVIWLDAQILMNPKVWEASWHVGWFNDPLIDCKKCKNRFRADKLIEEHIGKKNIWLAELEEKLWVNNLVPDSRTFEQQRKFFDEYELACANCGSKDWTDIRQFNLMFKTKQWTMDTTWADIYLRPETAQGIFVNFKNITNTTRNRVPFGIAQIGKAFRNEITPGNFIFRLREFEQMEIEYFIAPGTNAEFLEKWKDTSRTRRTKKLGIKEDNLRLREHEADELSHYSSKTYDIEYNFPWWWWELQWIADRTDFDLKAHQQHSWEDMQYNDPKTGKRYIPHVIEPSFGLTRALLVAMLDAYDEETYKDPKGNEQTRTVARFDKNVSPIKFAILPLIEKNEEMVQFWDKIFQDLQSKYMCEMDLWGNIGKRYRRQDEIWTPYCITIDHDSLEDGTVTVRDRDTMEQKRIKASDIVF